MNLYVPCILHPILGSDSFIDSDTAQQTIHHRHTPNHTPQWHPIAPIVQPVCVPRRKRRQDHRHDRPMQREQMLHSRRGCWGGIWRGVCSMCFRWRMIVRRLLWCSRICWPRDKKSMSSKAHLPRMLYVDSASLLYLESYKSRDKNADDSINHAGIQLLNFIGISTFDHSL